MEAEDEARKINPNSVSRDVLRNLLVAVGVELPQAGLLSGAMADWRNRGRASVLGGQKIDQYRDRRLPYRSGDHQFASVDEIGLVAGMTADILDRLRPWLSVYHEGGVSDAAGLSPAAVAVSDSRLTAGGATVPDIVSRNVIMRVSATAVVGGRARFVRRAVVRLRHGSGAPASGMRDLLQVLAWE